MQTLKLGLVALAAILVFKNLPAVMNGGLRLQSPQAGAAQPIKKPCPYANRQRQEQQPQRGSYSPEEYPDGYEEEYY